MSFNPSLTKKIIVLVVLSNALFSCTHLQFRKNDEETAALFKVLNVPTDISYQYVSAEDYKIRIQKVASTEDSRLNILFIHGSPSSISDYKSYLSNATLRKRANMYAIDRPGYGYSNFAKALPGINDQAVLINKVINKLDLQNLIVVGSSYGGPIAARLAVLNKNVIGIILLSPAIDPKNEKEIWGSRLTQWWITRWLVPTSYRIAGDEKTIHAEELAKLEYDWKKVTVPVLHLHGDADETVPFINTEYTKKVFSNIKVKVFEGYDHDLTGNFPELVIPVIEEYIDENFKDLNN